MLSDVEKDNNLMLTRLIPVATLPVITFIVITGLTQCCHLYCREKSLR